MPYVSDPNLDQDEQNQSGSSSATAPAGQVSGQPTSVSGSTGTQSQDQNTNSATEAPTAPSLASGTSVTGSTGGQGTASPSTASSSTYNPSAPTSGGQWTNLQNYLSANNGGQFGQQFAGNIGNDVSGAQTAVTNAATNFQNSVNSGTIQNNQGVINEVGTAPDQLSTADQATFENQLNGSYGGPQSAEADSGFQNAGQQAQAAYGEAQAANTSGGQQALLQKFYNEPTYSSGQQALDSAILSSDPNAQSAIQGVAAQASNLPVSYQQAATAADSAASQGQATTAAAQQTALASLYGTGGSATAINGGAFGNLQNAVQAQLTAAQAQYAAQQQIGADPTALTADQLQELGLTQGEHLYGVNVNQGLQLQDPNQSSVTTAEQAAQYAALSKLAGISNSFIGDPTQVGSYTGSYTNPTLQAQIAAQAALYNDAIYNPMTGNSELATATGSANPNPSNVPGSLASYVYAGQNAANSGNPNISPLAQQALTNELPTVQNYYDYGDVAGAPAAQGGISSIKSPTSPIHGDPDEPGNVR